MDSTYYSRQLSTHVQVLRGLIKPISPEQARWRPDPVSWSVLEVINHLYDEEREDFRGHLQELLENPQPNWHSIAPQEWVTARQYNERDFGTSCANYFNERAASLDWLGHLSSPDWTLSYSLPWGTLTAGELLAAWVAHDLLHIRQLTELNYTLLAEATSPLRIEYAGGW